MTDVHLESEFEKEFFASGSDVRRMLDAANKLCADGMRLYGVALTTSGDLSKHLNRLTEGWGKLRGFEVGGTSPYLIQIVKRDEDGVPLGKARAFMWQDSSTELCYFLTCQAREDFDYLFDLVHSYLQPDVCRLYLRTPQIEQSLRKIASVNSKLNIRVRQYVARRWRESRTHSGQVDTTVQYTDEDFAAVFRKLDAEEMWLSSLSLVTSGSQTCTGRISRDCSFSCTDGFDFFFGEFAGTLARTMLDLRTLYRHRGRIDSPTKASQSLKIVYKAGIFADKRNNHRLIRALEGCPNSALSVFHPNPYLHASLIDYADGSSYSILVSTATGILITPERKATAQSLARLCEYICDNFEEGDVVEFTPYDG